MGELLQFRRFRVAGQFAEVVLVAGGRAFTEIAVVEAGAFQGHIAAVGIDSAIGHLRSQGVDQAARADNQWIAVEAMRTVQIQTRSLDRLMRLFFKPPEVRKDLADMRSGVPTPQRPADCLDEGVVGMHQGEVNPGQIVETLLVANIEIVRAASRERMQLS